jgi:CheY-like chemotaxis protein
LTLHFNAKSLVDRYFTPTSPLEANRLIAIDTLIVDDHSRLTLTRNLKKVLPIMPKDTITVFQDKYNKDIIFTIQRENNTIDSLIIRRNYSRNRTDNHKSLENSQMDLQTAKEKPRSTLHDVNILLVDDESDLVKTYEWFLKSEGYHNIETFIDPCKTVKHLADLKNPRHYSLAIIDIRMPIINGIQLYEILKIFNPEIKVLFVSALDAAEELTSIYHIGHEDILRKPCERRDFTTTVNDAVLNILEER